MSIDTSLDELAYWAANRRPIGIVRSDPNGLQRLVVQRIGQSVRNKKSANILDPFGQGGSVFDSEPGTAPVLDPGAFIPGGSGYPGNPNPSGPAPGGGAGGGGGGGVGTPPGELEDPICFKCGSKSFDIANQSTITINGTITESTQANYTSTPGTPAVRYTVAGTITGTLTRTSISLSRVQWIGTVTVNATLTYFDPPGGTWQITAIQRSSPGSWDHYEALDFDVYDFSGAVSAGAGSYTGSAQYISTIEYNCVDNRWEWYIDDGNDVNNTGNNDTATEQIVAGVVENGTSGSSFYERKEGGDSGFSLEVVYDDDVLLYGEDAFRSVTINATGALGGCV